MSARSIKNRINFIQLVKELVADNDWDVFTASETWLNSTVSNTDINIAGYKLIRNDRRHWRGGGGSLCAHFKHLSSLSEHGFQQLLVTIQNMILTSFLLCVIEALLYGKTIIIMGDLNCDLLSDKPDTRVSK